MIIIIKMRRSTEWNLVNSLKTLELQKKVRNYIMRDLVKEWIVDYCIQVKQ